MHFPEAMGIEGHQVVLDKAAIFGLVLRDDAEIVITQSLRSVHCFALAHVRSTLLRDNVPWDFQLDDAVNASLSAMILLSVGIQGDDLVAKEPCRLGASMGDQRL